MSSEVGQARMLAFAKRELSEENMLFFIDLQRYNAANDAAARTEIGERIVATYLARDAKTPVNLGAKVTMKFTGNPIKGEAHGAYTLDADCFSMAELEIRLLLRKDTFARFLQCADATDLMRDHPELTVVDAELQDRGGAPTG